LVKAAGWAEGVIMVFRVLSLIALVSVCLLVKAEVALVKGVESAGGEMTAEELEGGGQVTVGLEGDESVVVLGEAGMEMLILVCFVSLVVVVVFVVVCVVGSSVEEQALGCERAADSSLRHGRLLLWYSRVLS
jgi:hypothetical protein